MLSLVYNACFQSSCTNPVEMALSRIQSCKLHTRIKNAHTHEGMASKYTTHMAKNYTTHMANKYTTHLATNTQHTQLIQIWQLHTKEQLNSSNMYSHMHGAEIYAIKYNGQVYNRQAG